MTHDHGHEHEGNGEGTYGMAFGFRTLTHQDRLYLVEAEVAPYVDEPAELGATLVFHPLEWVDPTPETDAELPAWTIDIDDDLQRKGSEPIPRQFEAIARQLHGLSEEQLRDYLEVAQEEAEEQEEE